MKHLYVTVLATSLLVACSGPKSAKVNSPAAKPSGEETYVIPDSATSITKAVSAFKGYEPNKEENKQLADQIIGADMVLDRGDETSKLANIHVLFSNCESVTKAMYGNQGGKAEVDHRKGAAQPLSGVWTLENKCIGKGGGCEEVAVLLSNMDKEGKDAKVLSQVAISFYQKKDGSYQLQGWPTAKKDAFKTVSFAAGANKCHESQVQQDKQEPKN